MLKIWNMKKDQAAAEKKKPKVTAAQIRLQKDLGELQLDEYTATAFPNSSDQMNFTVEYRPHRELYKGGRFRFSFTIGQNYPFEAPKVLCMQKIYHPNIDTEGHVCLNILREDWKPVLSIKAIIFGLQMLFLAPNPDDPLNKKAAEHMKANEKDFACAVARSMEGGSVDGESFDNVLC
ncbi:putative E2 ubiquitin-conjugating enzyme [Martensiomyces pterosporus]|nr:putative E2 ubiquitin-conjugating enzyme [Martensiomyces pterosporus]